MNKIIICALVLTAYMLTACESGIQGGDIELKTRQDSLSYAYGVSAITQPQQGMKALGIDLDIAEYRRGYDFAVDKTEEDYDKVEVLAPLSAFGQELQQRQGRPFTPEDQPTSATLKEFSYAYGVYNASTYVSCGYKVNIDATCAGMRDAKMGTPKLEDTDVQGMAMAFNQELVEAMQAEDAKKYETIKSEGENFLAENKNKPGVITTESGLQYKVLKKGSGAISPTATQTVKVHYEGRLIDGTVFDSSVKKGTPIEYPVNGFVPGWIEALQLMKVGDKFELYVPYDLGYGTRGQGGDIKPYAMLIFEMELLGIL